MTVDRLINQYIETECCPFNRSWKGQELTLKRELKPYLNTPADELTSDNVLTIVQSCLDRGSPRAAQEALKQISGLYNWAMGRKRVRRVTQSREDATKARKMAVIIDIARNPTDGVIAPSYKARSYHLEGKALETFSSKLAASGLRDDCKIILTIQMQTFCRVGEVSGLHWDELDLKKGTWLIPGERYKTAIDHTVMLSSQTIALLKSLPKVAPHVFGMPLRPDRPVPGRDVAKEVNKARASLKQHEDFTSHSLRHSGSTWLASQHCPLEVRERLMGHAIDVGDMAQRYQHHTFIEERRDWTQRWCDFLEGKSHG
jgi:integrase